MSPLGSESPAVPGSERGLGGQLGPWGLAVGQEVGAGLRDREAGGPRAGVDRPKEAKGLVFMVLGVWVV